MRRLILVLAHLMFMFPLVMFLLDWKPGEYVSLAILMTGFAFVFLYLRPRAYWVGYERAMRTGRKRGIIGFCYEVNALSRGYADGMRERRRQAGKPVREGYKRPALELGEFDEPAVVYYSRYVLFLWVFPLVYSMYWLSLYMFIGTVAVFCTVRAILRKRAYHVGRNNALRHKGVAKRKILGYCFELQEFGRGYYDGMTARRALKANDEQHAG